MHFALLGDHEDGLAMARALAESGRHQLRCYSGSAVGAEFLRRWNLAPMNVPDLEEVLADPVVEAVIVAGSPAVRAAQLRRALQAERHVLCVHPADHRADTAYEAASIRRETGRVLLPILPAVFHPAVERLAKLIAEDRVNHGITAHLETRASGAMVEDQQETRIQSSGMNREARQISRGELLLPSLPRLIEVELWSPETLLLDAGTPGHEPGFPFWEVLRCLAGEIVEVSAFGAFAGVEPEEPILLAGRFERGGLFQAALVPNQPQALFRLTVMLQFHQTELIFPDGWPGPARLRWLDETGSKRHLSWDAWDPWPRLVEAFEQAVRAAGQPKADKNFDRTPLPEGLPTWEDEVRCLELDDAARRSLERRRSSTLEFQEDIEEATFKGTMTLFGCALLWISLLLLILSHFIPWLGWLILPVFLVFLGLQLLRWFIPPKEPAPTGVPKTEEKSRRE